MKALTFINLVEICALFFELWEAEIDYLTGRVNNTCARASFLATDTQLCVLILSYFTTIYFCSV